GVDGETPVFEQPKDGAAGVSIAGAVINEDGELVLSLTDGRAINAGRARGKDGVDGETPVFEQPKDGAAGVSIAGAVINEDGELVLSLTDGRAI
ncbi:hypothetical protein, partial [Pseudomonas fluorescens]|uniref:hypothetical protein n=1 Tax=Pseudomonas fluorescens TaxID=294 RepID=UPI001CA64243